MNSIAPILGLAGIVIAFVGLRAICRSCVAQNRRPSLWLASGLSMLASLLMLLVLYSLDIFTRRFWADDRMPILAVMALASSFLIMLIPSLLIIRFYRRRSA